MMRGSQNKLVLCATANNLLAGFWHASRLHGSQNFANTDDGHQLFLAFLQQYPTTPVYLIADAVEEDYRLESLPHTSGSAKNELIERKLNQFYRGLDYRTAHFINREVDKRKDDKFLFAALNNADFLEAWVAIIRSVEAQLVGVYLLPMLSQVLVRQLKLMAPHILLCEKLSSGLRQTYLHNGRLRMSRLVPNLPTEAGQLGYFYLVETEKTRLYLMSQRLIARDTQLNLVLVSLDDSTQKISQAISQEQGIESLDINLTHMVKNLGLSAAIVQQMPELLHMQLLASRHLVDNLAPAALTKQYQFNNLKQGIKVATIMLTLIGFTVAGWSLKQAFNYKTDVNLVTKDTLIKQHQYDEVAKNFPVTSINASDLKIAVDLNETIEKLPKSPHHLMQVVSSALEKSPEIKLDRLRWVLTNEFNIKDEDKLIALTPASATVAAVVNTPVSVADPSTLNELGFITAEINGFTGNYRSALNSVNQFVSHLKADNRVSLVEVLQEPVNVSSFVNLEGSTSDEQEKQSQPALFKLKIMLKTPALVEVKK